MAGESATDQVDRGGRVGVDIADIIEDRHARPSLLEDGLPVGVLLGEPNGLHAHPLEAEVKAADAGEEGTNAHHFLSSLIGRMGGS